MSIGAGDAAGRIKNRIHGLVERIPTFEPTSRLEVRLNGIKVLSKSHISTLLLDSRQVIPKNSAVFIFPRTHISAERQILFIKLKATQSLRSLCIPH